MSYIRKGDCNGCGWCCQFEAVHRCTATSPSGKLSESDQRFYLLRGARVSAGGEIAQYLMHAYVPCEAYEEARGCSIYETRPDICRDFPSSPEQVEGSPCSFWFERTSDDGTTERRGGMNSPHPTEPQF